MFSSDQTKGVYLSEKGLTDVNNEGDNRITSEDQTKKRKTPNKNKKILSIGDNLNTDIKGANLLNYDSLLISNGIHKNEIEEKGIEKVSKSYEAICNYIQSEMKW